jgi:uncharacterized surface anchored protein
MKKTFGKRFISGMTSAALAASFVLGAFPGVSSVLMTSSAEAVTGFERDNSNSELSAANTQVKVNFKGSKGESVSVTTSDNTYYLLVHAVGKDVEKYGTTFKYFEDGETKDAYDLIEIIADDTDWTSPAFSLWETRHSVAEAWGARFEEDIVPEIVTMEGVFLKNSDPSKELTLEDAIAGNNCTAVDNIEGMELTDTGYNGHSSSGGIFSFDANGGRIKPAKYSVELSFDAPTTITEDDNIYLLVESDTANTDYKYVLEKLTVNGETSKIIDITDWYDGNGQSPAGSEYYDGSATKVTLLKASGSDLSVNNAVNRNNCGEIANGGFFKGSNVKYGRQTSAVADIPEYTEHISFNKASSVSGYDFRSILGNGLYYGMVIDRFEQGNHTESNYAVNHYEGNEVANTPDISGKFGGHFYFAEFVHFNNEINEYEEPSDYVNFDSMDFTVDPKGQFFIDSSDACCEEGAVLHFDSESRMRDTVGRDGIARIYEDKDTINGVIDPILNNMQSKSAELAALPVNAAATIVGGNAYISGEGYDDDAILVIDGDDIAPYIAESGKVHIELKGSQMVIFNFDEVTEARIDEFNIRRIGDADYQLSTTPSYENTLAGGKNYWLDQNATRNIVWNLRSVKALDINKATGIFLIPGENSVTRIKGTSSGWLQSAGYVNNPSGEWHFLYTDLPRNTTVVSVDKKNITGQEEVEGAQLKISTADGEELFSWESDGTTHEFRLAPGDYVLEETGDEFEYDGAVYKVLPSKVTFTVKADEDSSSYGCTIQNVKGTKNGFAREGDTSYCVYSGRNDIFTICDAEKVSTSDVTLRKTDITGETEVRNAVLAVFDEDGNKVDEWVSNGREHVIEGLVNGTYTLTEEAADGKKIIDDYGNEYDVIKSKVTFTVKDGKLTAVKENRADAVTAPKTGATESYVYANKGTNTITVCDAIKDAEIKRDLTINKTDITGENEVEGAQLTLTVKGLTNAQISAINNANANNATLNDWNAVKKGKQFVMSWTSGKEAAQINGLVPGTYTLTETGSAFDYKGVTYEVMDSEVIFTINEDGSISYESVPAPADERNPENSSRGYAKASGSTITICDASRSDITVSKKDITNSEEVIGAHLVIKDRTGNTIDEWDSNGRDHIVKGLANGTYTLTETAVDSAKAGAEYEIIPSNVTFTVMNGKITNVTSRILADSADNDFDEGYVLCDKDSNTITVCDAKKKTTKVTITKTDIAGTAEITGAVLTIKDSNGNTVTGTPWTSGKDGKVLELELTNGTYTLTETGDNIVDENGNEYDVIDSTLTFEVKDGKVTSVKNDTNKNSGEGFYDVDSDSNTITVNDAQKTTKVSITKTDIAGTAEITGAVLTIKDSNGNTVTGTPWTSGKDGKVLELELKNGTYTLTETGDNIVDENGNEYDVIDSTLTFEVKNGKVTSVKNDTDKDSGEGFYDVDSDSNTITVNDAQKTTKVSITKTDIAGTAEITGAVLTIKDSNGNTVTGTPWTSGKDGKVLELELKNGTYTLTETGDNIVDENGNEYDVIDSTLTFEVKNGKVTSVKNDTDKNSGEGFYDVDSDSNTITVNDAQKTTKVTITKTDIAGTAEITGAVLTIKDSNGNTVTGTPWTSGNDGKVLELELTNGTYTLTETGDNIVDENGNEYDVIDSTLTFEVKNGKVTSVKNDTDKNSGEGFYDVDSDSNTITVNDAQKTTKVTITKTDIAGTAEITGAVLTIKDSNGNTVTGTPWTSGKDGKVLELELKNGTYTLTETGDNIVDENGNEYEVIDSTLTFEVKNGKVTSVRNSTSKNSGEGFYDVDSDSNTITVNDAQKTTKVTITKTDIAGTAEITGAVLTIKDSDGNTVTGTPWTSGKDGKVLELELKNGTYTLTETGDNIVDENGNEYDVIDSTLTFEVKNGKVTSVRNSTDKDSGEGFYDVDSDSNTITVNDAQKTTKVTITKTDIAGTAEITGAVLTIKDSNGNTVTGTPWTSGKDGKVLELELKNGTYTLTETGDSIVDENGNEYDVIDSTLTFEVKNGKVISVKNDTDKDSGEGFFNVDSDSNTITVNDAMKSATTITKVTITKTDITGEAEITGAVLTIKDSNGNTVTGTPWTSGVDGEKLELELENGTYTLTETEGDNKIVDENGNEYEVIDSSLTFKVEDGKVTVVSNYTENNGKDGFYSVDSENNIITVSDAMRITTAKVTITKTDITGEAEIAGAVLTIKDSDGNIVTGTPWTSGVDGKKLEIELENGTYTLTETGDNITDADGNEYEVIESSLTFEVKDGKVKVVENNTDADSGEGFFTVDAGTNTITVNDAKKTVDESSSKPDTDDDSSKPEVEGPEDSSEDESQGDSSSEEDSSSDSSSSESSSSADSSSSSTADSSSSSTATSTSTNTNTDNPNTGARVLINGAEFAAAVGLCFLAIRRKKKDDDQ